jgi:hypothetical protein
MEKSCWLIGSVIVMALAAGAQGQSAVTNVPTGVSLAPPTTNLLVLSNVAGKVRVLDSKGLLLESNFVFLPRIPFSDLSTADLQALLETKTAYATLTAFESVHETNAQSAVFEGRLGQIWRDGKSLSEKIQTRLEILEAMHDYNNEIARLPGSMSAADQYAYHDEIVNDRLLTKEEEDERRRRLREAYNRTLIAANQSAEANQQVTDSLAKCAALATRLAGHGINVPAAPPFYPIPPLTMRAEVDAERAGN